MDHLFTLTADRAADPASKTIYSIMERGEDGVIRLIYAGPLPPASTTDADLDAAAERAAEAWGVSLHFVLTGVYIGGLCFAGILDPGQETLTRCEDGPTRLAAMNALAAKAKPRLQYVHHMSGDEVVAEINDRFPEFNAGSACYSHVGRAVLDRLLYALRKRDGASPIRDAIGGP